MKANTKNNPVTVGALLGVLGATLFFLMRQMGGGGSAPSTTLTPAADTREDAAPKLTPAGASAASDLRDPFDHPALRRAAKLAAPAQNLTAEGQAVEGQATPDVARSTSSGSNSLPLSAAGQAGLMPSTTPTVPQFALPYALRQAAASANAKTGGAGGRANAPSGSVANAQAAAPPSEDPLKGWRLTAIIAGRTPRAVIEGTGKTPALVGVGERVNRLEVTAIQEREIVLRDAHHLYTLPLTTAPSSSDDSKDADKTSDVSKDLTAGSDSPRPGSNATNNKDANSKDTTAEAILNAARENLNATAKKHL